MDEPLIKWFRQARDEKIPVSGEMLLLKAQEYAEVCGCENPKKLNMSWINRWKVRKDIVCKKLHGEAEFVHQNYQFIFDQLICFVLAQIKRSRHTP